MEFIKRNYKNILIGILVILLTISSVTVFYLLKKEKNVFEEIKGNVIICDSDFLIIESNGKNYLITNINEDYEIGDEVLIRYSFSDMDQTKNPYQVKASQDELINRAQNKVEDTSNNENVNQESENKNNSTLKPDNSTLKPENNTSSNTLPPSSNENVNTKLDADTEVIQYFTSLESDFQASTIKDSVKSGFITVVDFLFYNGKIKGYTFQDLTSKAKLKVLGMALYFDSKIEKYFPGYKENISHTSKKIYTNVSEKIVSTYLDLTTSLCNTHSELCSSAKEGFQDLKTNFGLTFDFIKDIAGDGILKLKNWYEIWSGK